MMAIIPTVQHPRDFTAKKQQMWEVFRPMRLVYTICTGMFGNGAAINGTITITAHRLMEVLGKRVRIITECCVLGKLARIITECSVVVPASTTRSIVAVPFVSRTRGPSGCGPGVFA